LAVLGWVILAGGVVKPQIAVAHDELQAAAKSARAVQHRSGVEWVGLGQRERLTCPGAVFADTAQLGGVGAASAPILVAASAREVFRVVVVARLHFRLFVDEGGEKSK